jgi:hypothetical protein
MTGRWLPASTGAALSVGSRVELFGYSGVDNGDTY